MRVTLLAVVASLVILFSTVAFTKTDYYRFDLRLDPGKGCLEGSVYAVYVNRCSEILSEVRFRLDQNLSNAGGISIAGIRDAQTGEDLKWDFGPLSYAGKHSEEGVLIIQLARPIPRGVSAGLFITYAYNDKEMLRSELSTLQDDPYDSLDAWYPKAMSFNGTDWSIDDDRLADYDLAIDLPADMLLASSGKVVDEGEIGVGQKRIRIQAERIRGFTIYASNQFIEKTLTSGDIEISLYYYEHLTQFADKFLEAAADAIEFMEKRFAPFPTKHFTIYCDKQGGGAFTSCNLIGLKLEGSDAWIENLYRWLIAHEVAHQYVGSLITEPRDTVKWLTAGLGLVMDNQYLSDRGFNHPMFDWLLDLYPQVKKMGYDTTLTQSVSDLYTDEDLRWTKMWNLALQHGKAFAVCMMLADLVGKERFLNIIGKIIKEKSGGTLYYPELIQSCEDVYGNSLSWFVDDWIEGDATLDYAIAGIRKGGAGWEVEINQIGSAAFPVVVEAETVSGKKLRRKVDRNLKTNLLLFETEEDLESVIIDPVGYCQDLDRGNNKWPSEDKASEG